MYLAVKTEANGYALVDVDSPTSTGDVVKSTSFKPGHAFILETLQTIPVGARADAEGGAFGFGYANRNEVMSQSCTEEDAAATMNNSSLSDDIAINIPQHDQSAGLVATAAFNAADVTFSFTSVLATARRQKVLILRQGIHTCDTPSLTFLDIDEFQIGGQGKAPAPALTFLDIDEFNQNGKVRLTAPALAFLDLDEFNPGLRALLTAPALTFLDLDEFNPGLRVTLTAPALTFLDIDEFNPGLIARLTAPALAFLDLDEFAPGLAISAGVGLSDALLDPFTPGLILRLPEAGSTLDLTLFADPVARLICAIPLTFLDLFPFEAPAAALLTNKKRIYDALMARSRAGDFRRMTYPVGGMVIIEEAAVPADTYELNDTRSEYIQAKQWRRTYKQQRGDWIWELHLAFDKEVTTELFERAMLTNPIRLPRDDANGLEAVIVRLMDNEWSHPPRQQSSNGTRATYRFVAEFAPV
jgi:hypothetical protein